MPIGTEGSSAHRAASIALLPSTDCRYCVVKKAEPSIPKAERRLRTREGPKPRPRKRVGSIIGDAVVRWRWTKRVAKSRPTVTETTYCGCQPSEGISLRP